MVHVKKRGKKRAMSIFEGGGGEGSASLRDVTLGGKRGGVP